MSPRHAPWAENADFAVGLRPIPEAAWLEGGEADPAARKDPLLAGRPQTVWGETEGSRPAQAEAMAMAAAALGRAIDPQGRPPLLAAARRVPDDLCLMEKRDGAWRLTALSLCAPTFFSAEAVLGLSLAELHGPVDGFAERFLARVERLFEGLRPGLVLERRNWTVVNSGETFTPDAAPVRAQIPAIDPADASQALFLRVERQTLRRLPETGAALFTIRVWLDRLQVLAEDSARLAAFARAWRGAAPAFRNYKRFALYDPLVEAFLRAEGESYSVNGPRSPS
ncbi:DUF3445 domain-containing protein [Phenylobacterium sp.]|jgi:hypothetical protein|uniref:heme-dependent oxidative N-demethylase family protein n=1 Tax=Phenylobacterium sp. TaxID=1871053 RepID=UPI002F42CA1C